MYMSLSSPPPRPENVSTLLTLPLMEIRYVENTFCFRTLSALALNCGEEAEPLCFLSHLPTLSEVEIPRACFAEVSDAL